jgi:ribosomal protein S27E
LAAHGDEPDGSADGPQVGYPSDVRCDHCGNPTVAFKGHLRCFGCGNSMPLPPDGSADKADIVPIPEGVATDAGESLPEGWMRDGRFLVGPDGITVGPSYVHTDQWTIFMAPSVWPDEELYHLSESAALAYVVGKIRARDATPARASLRVDDDDLLASMASEWGSPTVEELEAAGRNRPAGVP